MKVGISTSCFYPLETEKSLEEVGKLGAKETEIFFNSPSELSKDFLHELKIRKENFGIKVCAVHPFASFSETYMLFSEYVRRFYDTLDLYKRFMETAEYLGGNILVIHGCKKEPKISDTEYFERFSKLVEIGKEYNVKVAQENVVHYLSESPDFLNKMRTYMGDNFKMVFDVKQSVRAGYEPTSFAKEFAKNIVQVHVSDHNSEKDCLPPGEGKFDFVQFTDMLKKEKVDVNYIIELYSSSYESPLQISKAKEYLDSIVL